MSILLQVILATLLAGLAMPLGASVACWVKIKSSWLEQEFLHGVMAFGGGALISAVALVLVPEGIANLKPWAAATCFIAGGLAFMSLDVFLEKKNTPASQLAAMLSDFLPESLALGATFVSGSSGAFLLALLIGLQNLPEGFNALREMNGASSYGPRKIIALFALMAILGPIAGTVGYLWLADAHVTVSAIMLFASGGILYSVFQDIAPGVKLEKHHFPPMGAILGFVLGMVGFMMTS